MADGEAMSTAEVTDEADDPHTLMRADLARSGLTEKDAKIAGYEVGSGLFGGGPSYRLPYFDLDGNPFLLDDGEDFARRRLLGPLDPKDPQRYRQPPDSPTPAYLPPIKHLGLGHWRNGKWRPIRSWRQVANDPTIRVYETEGEKKAFAACKAGFLTIAVGGVDSWAEGRKKAGDRDHLVPLLREFNFNGREWGILYDSDAATKPDVQRAERENRDALQQRGAVVTIVRLPPAKDGTKQGLDDFLLAHGRDELRKLIDAATVGRLPDSLDDGSTLLEEYPPLEFPIEPYFPKGELAELNGPHGQFKSTLMLRAALSVATGEPFHTRVFAKLGKAVFISLEDRTPTLAKRVRCWLTGGNPLYQKIADEKRRTKEEREKLKDRIQRNFRYLGREKAHPLTLTTRKYGETVIRTANVDRIVNLCQGADLIVLETAARLHPGEESNEALAVLATALESIATRTGACVVLVRHVSKEQAQKRNGSTTSYAGRGGGSLADAARSVLSVVRVGDKQDTPVRMVHTKSTHTARGPDLFWRVDSTPLGPYLAPMEAPAQKTEQKAEASDRVLGVIRTAGAKGIGARDLQRKLPSGADPAEQKAAIKQLVASGQVTETKEARGRVVYRIAYAAPPAEGRS